MTVSKEEVQPESVHDEVSKPPDERSTSLSKLKFAHMETASWTSALSWPSLYKPFHDVYTIKS
jgi:hypothetical protein